MQAKDIMTKDVITLKPETTIGEAMKILIDHQVSGAPVVDDNGEIVGLVSEKDLLISYDFTGKTDGPIKEFISKDVIGVSEETSVKEISRLLVKSNIKRVPVLDGKKVLGIVSRRDVIRCILSNGQNG